MLNVITAGLTSRVKFSLISTAVLVLAGCGGGGGGSTSCLNFNANGVCVDGGAGGGTTTTATPAKLSLLLDTPTILTDGAALVTISATVKDSKNAVIPGVAVNFSADSGTISAASVVTDSSGLASITFNSNDNKSNRTVTFTVTAGSLPPQTTSVVVQGTRIGFGGDTSSVRGKPVSMSVSLMDGAGKAISGRAIALSSSLNNPVPTSVTTDASGQATVAFTPTVAGADTITATVLGAVLTQSLMVSAVDFAFSSPAVDTAVVVGECRAATVQLNGASADRAVFTLSRGLVYPSSTCDNASGSAVQQVAFAGGFATAYIKSPSAGTATVQAELSGSASSARASLPIKFIATLPKDVIVQGDPSVVIVGGASAITALLKDSDGNPVAGQTVFFSAPLGGGVPSPTSAVTNDSGIASTTFRADSSISAKDAVQVKASVTTPSGQIEGLATLTVAGRAVNVAIGTDNAIVLIENPPRYRKVWGVQVSDPSSGPVKNQLVTISLRGVKFKKGNYTVEFVPSAPGSVVGTNQWVQSSPSECDAEDANNNNFVEQGEVGDLDKDGVLEPNGAAIVRSPTATGGLSATVTTDDSGAAEFWIEYLRDYGSWAKVELNATATVTGQQGTAARSFYLPVPSSEILDEDVSPAFQLSPFGQRTGCNVH